MRRPIKIQLPLILFTGVLLMSLVSGHAQEGKGGRPSYLPPEGRTEFMTADEFLGLTEFKGSPVIKRGDPAKGRQLYLAHCTTCHGLKGDGKGPLAPVLDPKPKSHTEGKGKKPGEGMNEKSDEKLHKAIKEGGQGIKKSVYMPAWGHIISDEDIWNIIAYLRTIAIPPYAPPAR